MEIFQSQLSTQLAVGFKVHFRHSASLISIKITFSKMQFFTNLKAVIFSCHWPPCCNNWGAQQEEVRKILDVMQFFLFIYQQLEMTWKNVIQLRNHSIVQVRSCRNWFPKSSNSNQFLGDTNLPSLLAWMITPCPGLSGLFSLEPELALEAVLFLKSYWLSLVVFLGVKKKKRFFFVHVSKLAKRKLSSGHLS